MIIVGLDPGTHKFGLTLLRVDAESGKIDSMDTFGISVDDILNASVLVSANAYEDRNGIVVDTVTSILRAEIPEDLFMLAYEIPHFDRHSPFSYGVLIHHIETITKQIQAQFHIPSCGYRPSTIKKVIDANKKIKGENSKDAVLRAMKNHSLFSTYLGDLDDYTDDAIDSALIAYCGYRDTIHVAT